MARTFHEKQMPPPWIIGAFDLCMVANQHKDLGGRHVIMQRSPQVDLSHMDYDAILAEVNQIRSEKDTVSHDDLKRKHAQFAAQYSKLFEKCTDPSFEYGNFLAMISLLQKVRAGSVSKHDADVTFSQGLVDKYGGIPK